MHFVDAHCHFHFPSLEASLRDVLSFLSNNFNYTAIVNGTCEDDWEAVSLLAKHYTSVLPSYGVHPWKAHLVEEGWQQRLEAFIDDNGVGVGECGLDKWIQGADLKIQIPVFEAQLAIALQRNLPVSIHCLHCWGTMLDVLRNNELPQCGFLLHSYGGPKEMLYDFLELGAYFSLSGYFLHERNQGRRDLFSTLPEDRLLIETDAPEMPLPGQARSQPDDLLAIYEAMTTIRGMKLAVLCELIESNAYRLFRGLTS